MKGFLKALVLVPLAAAITLFAVINREPVHVTFDPLEWSGFGQSVTVPLFVVIFAAVAIGVILGGSAVWLAQGRHRRAARSHAREAARHREELARIKTDGAPTALPAPSTLR
ncbi:lipopolysaccharide assembly protein LapA domain-containing protein [Alsobacter sp. R-9]